MFEATRYEATHYVGTRYEATRYEATRYEATRYEATRYEATRYEATRSPKWYRHRMTPATMTTTSQQVPYPTATGKQTRTGTKYPVQGSSLTLIYIYI